MTITYRDELGIVEQEIDPRVGITFCNGLAYCTSADGNSDFGVHIENIVSVSGI